MTKQEPIVPGDFIWGVPGIARYIKRSNRTTYYMISKGFIPVVKFGARTIAASKSKIDRAFSEATNTTPPRAEPKASTPRAPKRRLSRRIVAHAARAGR